MPPESLNLKEMFARAYSQAALADANMREAAGALESVHDRLNSGLGYHDVLSGLDEQTGQVDLVRLVPALQEFRRSYTRWVVESETRRFKDAYNKDATGGWLAWLTAYTQIFQETAWRTELGQQLAQALTATPDPNWPVSRVQRNAWLICRERWPEAYDWVIYLTEQDIPPEFRARMLAIAAEIQLYRFVQPTKADALLKRAEQVEPGEHITARARAAISFEAKAFDEAKRLYQAIVDKKPRLCDGYLGLAECADAEGDAAAAEAFYVQAIRSAPGMTSGQRGLMNWYTQSGSTSASR